MPDPQPDFKLEPEMQNGPEQPKAPHSPTLPWLQACQAAGSLSLGGTASGPGKCEGCAMQRSHDLARTRSMRYSGARHLLGHPHDDCRGGQRNWGYSGVAHGYPVVLRTTVLDYSSGDGVRTLESWGDKTGLLSSPTKGRECSRSRTRRGIHMGHMVPTTVVPRCRAVVGGLHCQDWVGGVATACSASGASLRLPRGVWSTPWIGCPVAIVGRRDGVHS